MQRHEYNFGFMYVCLDFALFKKTVFLFKEGEMKNYIKIYYTVIKKSFYDAN